MESTKLCMALANVSGARRAIPTTCLPYPSDGLCENGRLNIEETIAAGDLKLLPARGQLVRSGAEPLKDT